MPPKDPVKADVRLYFQGSDGQLKPIGNVTDADLNTTCDEPYMHLPFSNDPIEFEMKLKKPIGRRMMVFLLTGKWLSNNWMKMHGFLMERKGYGKGKRCANTQK